MYSDSSREQELGECNILMLWREGLRMAVAQDRRTAELWYLARHLDTSWGSDQPQVGQLVEGVHDVERPKTLNDFRNFTHDVSSCISRCIYSHIHCMDRQRL